MSRSLPPLATVRADDDPSDPTSVSDAHSRTLLRDSFLQLTQRFRPQEATGLDLRWTVEVGGVATTVHVAEERCFVSTGPHPRADASIHTDMDTWLDLVSGRSDGIAAFTAERLHVTGDLNVALRLGTLFRPGAESRRFLRTARIDAGGVEIESIVAGRGTPVVLLHGLGASKVSFLPTIDGLADGYQVHALDLPGFGRSAKPLPSGRRYSPGWMADVVRDYLRVMGIPKAHIVGNSLGGRVALELALRHPGRVRSMTGLGSAVAFDEYQWAAPWLRLLRSQWLGLAPFPVKRELLERVIGDLFHDPDCLPARNVAAAADQVLADLRDRRYRLAILACARHLGGEPARGRRSFWKRMEGMSVPSYWVFGAHDKLCRSSYCERIRAHAPNARCEVWDGVGHVPQFEAPARTNAALIGYFEHIDAA